MEVLVLVVDVGRDGDAAVNRDVEGGDLEASRDALRERLHVVQHLFLRQHLPALVDEADFRIQISIPNRGRAGPDRVGQLLRLPTERVRHGFRGGHAPAGRETDGECDGRNHGLLHERESLPD